jgi:nucleoside phosphorylase
MLGMIAALEYEAALVRRWLRAPHHCTTPAGRLWRGCPYAQDVVLLRSGMGPERATRATHWLAQHYTLHGLISIGFAGGLQDSLETGSAIVPQQIRPLAPRVADLPTPEEQAITPDPRLAHLAAMAAQQARLTPYYGTLLSAAAVLPDAATKAAVGQRSGALAVDMESFCIGQAAAAYALPFMACRTIFDRCDAAVPSSIQQWTLPDGTLQCGRILRDLAVHPHTLVQLPALWRQARRAGYCLTIWLQHFLALLSAAPPPIHPGGGRKG